MSVSIKKLQEQFGQKLQENVRMANYTTARVGGPVAGLLPINTEPELIQAAQSLWDMQIPFRVVGSGSNILVSDKGFEGVILLNRAHTLKIHSKENLPSVFAESGTILSTVARQSALRGLSGLEWAAAIPGTVGGAVYGNAGAHGADINSSLIMATILHPESGIQKWPAERLDYQYRSSILKRQKSPAVILSALFKVQRSTRETAVAKIKELSKRRKDSQPHGASLGSTFKNPPGDYAGRLIEAVGLKGYRIGHAQISQMHANFIINNGGAAADDIYKLIRLAQTEVQKKFDKVLEPEIELLGEFNDEE